MKRLFLSVEQILKDFEKKIDIYFERKEMLTSEKADIIGYFLRVFSILIS
jgi:hypothetical protein